MESEIIFASRNWKIEPFFYSQVNEIVDFISHFKRNILVNPIVKQFKYGQHTVTLETGAIARQATAAVMASMDDTTVFVTVVAKKDVKEGQDFFH